ncbi:MAG TPA: hypothetical protein VEU76_07135 [Candidatus Udaeobacter sp.]|nr:hypothetical protein [Candidatus Udaeobacter sp.]
MPELEQRLTALAPELEWPPTPALRALLPLRRPAPARPWTRPLAVAAAVLLVAAAAMLAVPPTRDAIAGWLNLHTIFQRVQTLPTPSSLPSGKLGEQLGLGGATSLQDAQGKVTWHVSVPGTLGSPDAVYYEAPPDGPSQGEVSLVYASRPGIKTSGATGVAVLITEARGTVQEQFFAKMLSSDATLEAVTIGGHQGYWISGHPHVFVFLDSSGGFRTETMRLATNTLILDEDGTIVRIEGDLTKAQALQIAGSLA